MSQTPVTATKVRELFFPVPVAIAATAVVHLANNIFKVFLVGRKADWGVVARFAIPGAGAALIGAALLNLFAHLSALHTYQLGGHKYDVTVVKVVIGVLIIGFALFELLPRFCRLSFDRKYLPLGGFFPASSAVLQVIRVHCARHF